MVFRENDACPGVFVVGQGLVRVFKTGAGGKEQVLHMVGPGETFAEVAAIGGFNCRPRLMRWPRPRACCCRWNASAASWRKTTNCASA